MSPPATAGDAPRRRSRLLAAPLLIGAAVWLVSLAALVRWSRGEAEARRSLTLRAEELVAFLARDVETASWRDGPGRERESDDAAPAWRDVLSACDEAAAVALAGAPRLPSLAADPSLANSLRAALGARRFAPFAHPEEIVDDPWPRRVRVFARMLANGLVEPKDRVDWLAGALALASDLRAVGGVEHGAVAAEIDDGIVARLGDGALAANDAARLAVLLEAALRRLPAATVVAEREARRLQTTVCALAEIAPLHGSRLRADGEPPLPLQAADAAVVRLDRLPALMEPLLASGPDAAAAHALAEWRDAFGRELPRIALLLPTSEAAAATARAPERLARLLERLRRQAGGRG